MRIRKTIYAETLHKIEVPTDAIVLYLDSGIILVSWKFQSQKLPLEILCYLPIEKKWVKTYAKDSYTETMWNYYIKRRRKHNRSGSYYANLMRHDRKHKGGGGGTRLWFTGTVTDYECTNNPMHDFRRVWN